MPPPINLYSPNTMSKIRLKIFRSRKLDFVLGEHNIIGGRLEIIFRNFQEFDVISKNFRNSENLTSFPRIAKIPGNISRTTSYRVMFS